MIACSLFPSNRWDPPWQAEDSIGGIGERRYRERGLKSEDKGGSSEEILRPESWKMCSYYVRAHIRYGLNPARCPYSNTPSPRTAPSKHSVGSKFPLWGFAALAFVSLSQHSDVSAAKIPSGWKDPSCMLKLVQSGLSGQTTSGNRSMKQRSPLLE